MILTFAPTEPWVTERAVSLPPEAANSIVIVPPSPLHRQVGGWRLPVQEMLPFGASAQSPPLV